MIGEGGNLGVTSLGRVEFDLIGGRINTDAMDNSAGVDCSDHEVNIKILIDSLVTAGKVDPEERTELLAVDDRRGRPSWCWPTTRDQNDLMGTSRANAASMLPVHARQIRDLEAERGLNRELEALPSEKEIRRRTEAGIGLTSPELATLMAHVKLALKDEVLASDLPDQEVFAARLPQYFPSQLRDQFSRRDPHPPAAPRDRHHDAGQRRRRHGGHLLCLPGHRGRRGRAGRRGAHVSSPPTRSSASSDVWRRIRAAGGRGAGRRVRPDDAGSAPADRPRGALAAELPARSRWPSAPRSTGSPTRSPR